MSSLSIYHFIINNIFLIPSWTLPFRVTFEGQRLTIGLLTDTLLVIIPVEAQTVCLGDYIFTFWRWVRDWDHERELWRWSFFVTRCRWNERLEVKTKGSMCLVYTGLKEVDFSTNHSNLWPVSATMGGHDRTWRISRVHSFYHERVDRNRRFSSTSGRTVSSLRFEWMCFTDRTISLRTE
jgi:hypothetical protein